MPGHQRCLLSLPTRRSSDLPVPAPVAEPVQPKAPSQLTCDPAFYEGLPEWTARLYDARHAPVLVARHRELVPEDRKSTRLNSSHLGNSYAVFCLKKKTDKNL